MSNKMIAIIVGIILLLFFMISGKRNNMLEHLTDTPTTSLTSIDVEALQNLSSMYNSATGTVSLNNATIAGDLNVTGKTNIGSDLNVTGKTLSKYYSFNANYMPDYQSILEASRPASDPENTVIYNSLSGEGVFASKNNGIVVGLPAKYTTFTSTGLKSN